MGCRRDISMGLWTAWTSKRLPGRFRVSLGLDFDVAGAGPAAQRRAQPYGSRECWEVDEVEWPTDAEPFHSRNAICIHAGRPRQTVACSRSKRLREKYPRLPAG